MLVGTTGNRTLFLAVACVAVVAASVWVAIERRGAAEPGGVGERETPTRATTAAFTDITLEAGIDFVHDNGARGDYLLCEIMGPGGALFDYDGDGWLDVFLVQSGVLGEERADVACRLYRNDGAGGFTDVSEASGVALAGYGMGCAVGDHDGDGTPDLYVTRVGPDALLANQGDGTFRDVTAEAGLANDGYTSSACWFDGDGDGRLDLYVARYTDLAPLAHVPCTNFLGHREYCDPSTAD
ncbi:MAG TPA: FG-GAP-like repeat-containing protein [Planctomycetota bacterium]|nr:FG-GAP-like repeat-containing protein [Planctomycetota bacterium]